jgi:hypothetical protein
MVQRPKSIDDIAGTLIGDDILSVNHIYEARLSAKLLVFSILGLQTMLYKPDLTASATGQFCIVDETDGYHGEARLSLSQPPPLSQYDLPKFLRKFGMMLPPGNYCPFKDGYKKRLFERTRAVNPKGLNAHVLTKVCGVRIQWVDSLSCHLELDRESGTLFLYRYPSFCVWNISALGKRGQPENAIYRCMLERPGQEPLVSAEDVDGFLHEILLSYRLLFGQSRRSRRVLQRLKPFSGIPREGRDPILSQVCSQKRFGCPFQLDEREEYDLREHFPHLRSRIVRLHKYVSDKKPRSIKQLL